MAHRFAREELYELVWSKPMSKLAKELGVSDVGLAKACKRIGIPVPGVGYWARLRNGKAVVRASLPPAKMDAPAMVEISPSAPRPQPPDLPPEVVEQIARESAPEWKIRVPKTLSNLRPIIHAWSEDDRRRAMNVQGGFHGLPSLQRRTKTERRRLRILSTLFKALEKRGHKVVADPTSVRHVVLIVEGENIEFTLSQRQRQFEEPPTPRRIGKGPGMAHGVKPKVVQRLTDELVLRIRSWVGPAVRTEWRDAPDNPLEDQLNNVVIGLLIVAVAVRRHRLELEDYQRRRRAEEIERLRQEEVQREEARRMKGLLQRIVQWRQAADIRAYVEAVRDAAKSKDKMIDQGKIEQWTSWALACASEMDPLVSDDPLAV